jgi:hypothetical protein
MRENIMMPDLLLWTSVTNEPTFIDDIKGVVLFESYIIPGPRTDNHIPRTGFIAEYADLPGCHIA